MKKTLLFLVKFICLTAPLIWLWQNGGLKIYHSIYSPIASAIYEFLGFEGVGTPARDRYVNIVPFVALMILTPNLSKRRRFGGTAIGLLVLLILHIAVNLGANPATLRLPRRLTLVLDAAPFIVWVAIANDFVRDFIALPGTGADPEKPADGGDS